MGFPSPKFWELLFLSLHNFLYLYRFFHCFVYANWKWYENNESVKKYYKTRETKIVLKIVCNDQICQGTYFTPAPKGNDLFLILHGRSRFARKPMYHQCPMVWGDNDFSQDCMKCPDLPGNLFCWPSKRGVWDKKTLIISEIAWHALFYKETYLSLIPEGFKMAWNGLTWQNLFFTGPRENFSGKNGCFLKLYPMPRLARKSTLDKPIWGSKNKFAKIHTSYQTLLGSRDEFFFFGISWNVKISKKPTSN